MVLLSMLLGAAPGAAVSLAPAAVDCARPEITAGPVRFCTVREALSAVPLLEVGGKTRQLVSEGQSLFGFVGAASLRSKLPGKRLIVAVLDTQVEGSGHELMLIASRDDGSTWAWLPELVKPHWLALFRSLQLLSASHWRLSVSLDDCGGCGVAPGITTFETNDAGLTWSRKK